MPDALCPMPDARCSMPYARRVPHITEKGYSISRGTKKEKGDTLIFVSYCWFFLAKLADNWDAKQAISLLTSWRSHLPTYPTKHT
jgi:hypothetical protein